MSMKSLFHCRDALIVVLFGLAAGTPLSSHALETKWSVIAPANTRGMAASSSNTTSLGEAPPAALGPSATKRPSTILIVRHAETDQSLPATLPLSPEGRARAEQLAVTLRDVRFTHLLATHTTRAKQMLDPIGATQSLRVVQLPEPGSVLDGQPVADQTSRRAPIEPIARALLALPPGSVALVALNSENIYAILNRLGVPQAVPGTTCSAGEMCVPCTDNSCYPRNDFDHLWHVVLQAGQSAPLTYTVLRYGAGWRAK